MEKIYFNGEILTMETPKVSEAIFIIEDKIVEIGSNETILSYKTDATELIDLKGKCLMPSFIDPHSHITAFANTLSLVPLNNATSFKDVIEALRAFKESNNLQPNKWIIGFGYDHNSLVEKAHLTKLELDAVSTENPILIAHASGHMGVANSKALEIFNIDSSTENPVGGLIGRCAGTNEPNGYLEENAFINSSKHTEKPTLEDMLNNLKKAQQIYASFGITTVQDGMVSDPEFFMLKSMSDKDLFILDVIGYVDLKNSKHIINNNPNYIKNYVNNFKLGGFKIFQDGSPQGRTAWLTKPYENGEKDYCGYPIYKNEEIEDFIKISLENNLQLLAHCNGDASSDQLINAYNNVLRKTGFKNDIRPVMVHAQTVRDDQLVSMKNINMIPSFFIAHINVWGDIHIKNLGMKRASHISPAKEALKLNIPYTFHQDTPVIPPNMLHTIWTAVNRITNSGVILGEDQCISTFDALKGITINAAYQYFEENSKGTLTKGKLADLVILDKNPLNVDPMKIKDIKVLETIKNGKTIFKL